MDPVSVLVGALIGAVLMCLLEAVGMAVAFRRFLKDLAQRAEDPDDVGDEIGDAFPALPQLDPLTP